MCDEYFVVGNISKLGRFYEKSVFVFFAFAFSFCTLSVRNGCHFLIFLMCFIVYILLLRLLSVTFGCAFLLICLCFSKCKVLSC